MYVLEFSLGYPVTETFNENMALYLLRRYEIKDRTTVKKYSKRREAFPKKVADFNSILVHE